MQKCAQSNCDSVFRCTVKEPAKYSGGGCAGGCRVLKEVVIAWTPSAPSHGRRPSCRKTRAVHSRPDPTSQSCWVLWVHVGKELAENILTRRRATQSKKKNTFTKDFSEDGLRPMGFLLLIEPVCKTLKLPVLHRTTSRQKCYFPF